MKTTRNIFLNPEKYFLWMKYRSPVFGPPAASEERKGEVSDRISRRRGLRSVSFLKWDQYRPVYLSLNFNESWGRAILSPLVVLQPQVVSDFCYPQYWIKEVILKVSSIQNDFYDNSNQNDWNSSWVKTNMIFFAHLLVVKIPPTPLMPQNLTFASCVSSTCASTTWWHTGASTLCTIKHRDNTHWVSPST